MILFEKASKTGNGFRVHLDMRLRAHLSQSFVNADYSPELLTETGKKICEGIAQIPGIDREIMVSTYSFETGIGHAFDPKLVIEQVIAVIESVGEDVQLGYLLPENRVKLVDRPELIGVEDMRAAG
jgi:hypothetical protein